MLTYCATTGLLTLGSSLTYGSLGGAWVASGQAIPDLLETQAAQMRLTSDQGVTSTHQVLASVKIEANQGYPSAQKTEYVLCPVSGAEMPLIRLLVVHDEPRQRLVLRLPESFRSRLYAVLRWWFDYLAVSPRRLLPAYAAQPQIEFVHPTLASPPSEALPAQNFLAIGTKILTPEGTSPAALVGALESRTMAGEGRVGVSAQGFPQGEGRPGVAQASGSSVPASGQAGLTSAYAPPTQPPPSLEGASPKASGASSTSTRSLKAVAPAPASLTSPGGNLGGGAAAGSTAGFVGSFASAGAGGSASAGAGAGGVAGSASAGAGGAGGVASAGFVAGAGAGVGGSASGGATVALPFPASPFVAASASEAAAPTSSSGASGKKATLLPSFEDLLAATGRPEAKKRPATGATPAPLLSPTPASSPAAQAGRTADKGTQLIAPKKASTQDISSLLPPLEGPKTPVASSKVGASASRLSEAAVVPPTILGTLVEEAATPAPPPRSPSRPSHPALPAAQRTQALGSGGKGVFASLLGAASEEEEDEIEESVPTLMSPLTPEVEAKKPVSTLALEEIQEVADSDIEEIGDLGSLPSISSDTRDAATQISSLSPEAAKILGVPSFDLQRERDQLSALLEPSGTTDLDKALTRASMRGVPESFDLPDSPTVARPAPQALAEIWASKATGTPVGSGLSLLPEPLSPKTVSFAAEWKKSGRTSWVSLEPLTQKASLAFLAPESISALFDQRLQAQMLFQVQRMPSYPLVLALLTLADENDQLQQIFSCPLDPEEPSVLMFLDFLMQRFSLQILFCNDGYQVIREMSAQMPLEQNIEYLLDQARAWKESLPVSSRSFLQALETLQQSDIDTILGKKAHNFHEASFADVTSPAAAQLASGIVGYWSEKEQADYLIAVKSFPLKTFREIQIRVIRACLTYGIALPPSLLSAALSLRVAADPSEILRTTLSNFAEINLQISHPNDLTPEQIVENWQKLFDLCDQHGVEVDPEIETLAERAVHAYEKAQEQPISVEEIEDVEVFDDYEEMKTEDLLALLQDPAQRLEAIRALSQRGEIQAIDAVASVFPMLAKEEVVGFAEAFSSFGRDAEPLLLSWLHLPRPYQREAAMLALGSLGSEQAIEAIIKRLRSTDEWETAAEALGRMGDLAVPLLSREMKNKNWLIRFRAVKALQKIQTPDARRQIEFLANDPNEVVKAEVLKSLQ